MGHQTHLAADPGPTAAEVAAAAKTGSSATALAPGFRFHPTDEELVSYYLKRKVTNKTVRFNAIADVDIYKHEPWNLSDKSRLKTRDQEWYFFSSLDKKYGNGGRMNRATNQGYWKATGKDREVRHNSQLIGMKKTLVFHSGKAPDGLRTNWVMHEYRIVEEELERIGALQGYVLCRVIHKNNIGPPNGNRYAPFIEAEWDDDSATLVPGVDTKDDAVAANDSIAGNDVAAAGNAVIESNGVQRIGSEQDIQYLDEDAPPSDEVLRESPNERTDDRTLLTPCKIDRSDDCLPLCTHNRESPLSLFRYKRRRLDDSGSNHANISDNTTRMTQDHCPSTATITMSPSSATKTAVSALLEFSLAPPVETKESPREPTPIEPKESLHDPPLPIEPRESLRDPPPPIEPRESPCDPPPPNYITSSLESVVPPGFMKLIVELQNEVHKISIERETLKLEMMSAETMISILRSKINSLIKENEDLKRRNRDV